MAKNPDTKQENLVLRPLNEAQTHHIAAVRASIAVFATGPAGTGKTYCHAAWAAQMLRDKRIETVVLTRPAVESGRSLGYLKGDLQEKFAPYLVPFRDVFVKYLGQSYYEYCLKVERIRPIPISLIQGVSLDDAVILADEMENATCQEMKLLLTRVGERSKILVSGDLDQVYIRERSGLQEALEKLQDVQDVSFIGYDIEDVVRSKFVQDVLRAYSR